MRLRIFKYLAFFTLTVLLVQACASFGTPSGGPKDKTPPALDSVLSEQNFQTNFSKMKFELYFDEFVNLKDWSKKLLVSPPLLYKPKLTTRAKKIIFEFNEKEELKKEATYVINFNGSIVDYTEGNPLQNFNFVFSTGDVIDSLALEGEAVDILSGLPIEDITVAMYDTLADSIIVLERPFYLAKTDKNGNFKFQNLKPDTFIVVAFKDDNLNQKYDPKSEMLGFLDQYVVLNDSSSPKLKFEICPPEKSTKILKKLLSDSVHTKLLLDSDEDFSDLKTEPDSILKFELRIKDTLTLFTTAIDSFQVITPTDTMTIKQDNEKNGFPKFELLSDTLYSHLYPRDSIFIKFGTPIEKVDTSLINISDSIDANIEIRDFQILVRFKIKPDSVYKLNIPKGTVSDIYQNSNDSLTLTLVADKSNSFGKINLTLDSLDSAKQYVMEFFLKNEKIDQKIIKKVMSYKLSYDHLKPGSYGFSLIEDLDKNGRWTTSDYWTKRKPEVVKSYKLEELRGDWELEDIIIWNKSEVIQEE
ncbi:MAG TPA: Ig-like domain-containing protein [Saprospiraceae bacterium]|nr:Ig-like domain-containing protein [Lewinellaceae bacterium]HRX27992.1 Ig-like domain-containing protein [Saprospiraceae bacterium]